MLYNYLFITKYPLYELLCISYMPITRYSHNKTNIIERTLNNPEYLAREHINSGKPITSSVINELLLNQNLSVNDKKLEQLLKIQGVEIDLPIVTLESKKFRWKIII